MINYGALKVTELRAELKKRNAKSTGVKDVLVDRLISYDRNNNFGEDLFSETGNDDLTSASAHQWPPNSDFKSVSPASERNKLNSVHITDYFLKCSKKDVSMFSLVLRKGYGMLEGEFLAALIEARDGDLFFYQSQVNSEFTKRLTYFSKIIVSKEGDILEGSCECVAGAGIEASCKHIAVTCFAVLRYNDRGVWPTRKTCTENPQKWHVPKKQKVDVSPKKTHQLSYHVPVCEVSKKRIGTMVYDPRPMQFRNVPSFSDSVRNSVINNRSSSNGSRSWGILGLYGPACVTSLAMDHDYLQIPLHHQWVLNHIQALAEDSLEIEKRTRSQSKSKEWKDIRRFIVTASHVGEIVHFTERRDQEAYAKRLVDPIYFSTAATRWGQMHEKDAIAEFEKMSHIKVKPSGLFLSKEYPFIGATPDGLVCELTVLEAKCPYSVREKEISPENVSCLEIRDGELKLKRSDNYYYQVQTQLLATGRKFCDFVVWTLRDCKRISVNRNDEVVKNVIIPKIRDFHKDYMVPAIAQKFYSL